MNFQICSGKFEFSDKYLNLSTVYEMCLHSCILYCEKPAFLRNFSLVSDIVEQCSLFLCTQELGSAAYDNILATNLKVCLSLSPLSSHSVGSPDPELADTTLFFTFFLRISKLIFRLYGNKSKTCTPVFQPYGNLNSRRSQFFGLTG